MDFHEEAHTVVVVDITPRCWLALHKDPIVLGEVIVAVVKAEKIVKFELTRKNLLASVFVRSMEVEAWYNAPPVSDEAVVAIQHRLQECVEEVCKRLL